MVLYDKQGKVIAVYPPGSEEYWRFYRVLEILAEARKRRLEKLLSKKQEREEQIKQILYEPDKKIIRRAERRRSKRYNLSQAAIILDVPRQSLYYWIKRGWVKPRRDCRRYPVFTVFDIEEIIKWRNAIK